jgi:hypothetical protein
MIMDNDILRAWLLIHELSDQLAHNQKISNTIHSQATSIKVCRVTANIRSFHMFSPGPGRSRQLRFCVEAV